MTAKKRLVVLMCLLALLVATGAAITTIERVSASPSVEAGTSSPAGTHIVVARGYERFRTTDIAAP